MVLTTESPTYLHFLQNAFLILLSTFFTPLCTLIACLSWLISPFTDGTKHIKHHRHWREISSSTFRPRTVLITGVGMTKGLTLARAFYRAGHRVLGADFEPYYIPVTGHFSSAIEKFYRLSSPTATSANGSAKYIQDLVDIITEENVELWVSCSGAESAVSDGEAAETIEKETKCKAIQFDHALTETLHENHSFISHTKNLGLNVPTTHLVTSETEALSALYPSARSSPRLEKSTILGEQRYIMKPIGIIDTLRGDMTLLPLASLRETEAHIRRLNPTPFRPFVLQQFINGPEYCTHALMLKGKIKAFVACPSSNLQMHYVPLPTSSALSLAMYHYTTIYARKTRPLMTGHFSLDFLVPSHIARKAEQIFGATAKEIEDLMQELYPIECNPRANTAVVLFKDESEDLSETYLSLLSDSEPRGITNNHRDPFQLVVPKPSIPGYYFINHDFVALFLLPVLLLLRREIAIGDLLESWSTFVGHVLFWREANFEIWDPWPWCWGIVGYWPMRFGVCVWERRWWSRCNVSTRKLFEC